MRALVTGSAGFVGRHLCPKLEAAGYKVFGLDPRNVARGNCVGLQQWHFSGSFEELSPRLDERIRDDGAEPPFFDLAIHLGANIQNVDARMHGGMDTYSDIELDLAMCRWLEKNPPKQCALFMSSCAVDYPLDPYCIVKRNLESFARTLHEKGVPVTVLRPFSGYGEDQSKEYPFRAILERALAKENPLTVWGGHQTRDFLHVDDLTDAILFAIKNCPRRPDPIEVGTRKGTSFIELANMMAEVCNYAPVIFCDDKKAASSLHRVAGEQGNAILQAWGWAPKIELKDAIYHAVANRALELSGKVTSCPA
jgi:nucleoside-diphosphate-sugar epimerase